MRNSTQTIFDVLARQDVMRIIKEDNEMTKHRIKLQFNDPPESYYAEMIYHLLGPYTEKMIGETNKFKNEISADLWGNAGQKTAEIYLDLKIAMKPGGRQKYQQYCTKLQKLFDDNKPQKSSWSPEMHLKLSSTDNSINVRFIVILSGHMNPLSSIQIPQGFREGLKNTDQYVKLKVVMGADAEEILSSDKPIVEHYLKGFSI